MKLKKITKKQAVLNCENVNGDSRIDYYVAGWNDYHDTLKKLKAEKKANQLHTDPRWTPEMVKAFNEWKPEHEYDVAGSFLHTNNRIDAINKHIGQQTKHLKDMFESQERENKRLHGKIDEMKHYQGMENNRIVQEQSVLSEKLEQLKLKLTSSADMTKIENLVARIEKLESKI